MAEIIEADGTIATVVPENGKTFKLAECQKIVGGYVEMLRLPKRKLMLLNEEGKLHGLRYNVIATEIAQIAGVLSGDYIRGDVLFCDDEEFK